MNKAKKTQVTSSPTASQHHWLMLAVIALLLGIIILGVGFYLGTKNTQTTSLTPTEFPAATPTVATDAPSKAASVQAGLANPASAFCTKQGGVLSIETRGDGGQYGLCTFEDNYACEEWAMFRGECPIGGIRTTGFDNIEQKYCAWSGGSTLAVENATCTFPNGSTCDDLAYYNGTCSASR